eukprot:UN25963
MTSCVVGDFDLFIFLITNGGDITISDDKGLTCIDAAASQGHVDIYKFLLDKGENPSAMKQDGFSPIHRICFQNTAAHIECLAATPRKHYYTGARGTHENCLMSAGRSANIKVIQYLIEDDFDPLTQDANGWNVLHYLFFTLEQKVDNLKDSDTEEFEKYYKHYAATLY